MGGRITLERLTCPSFPADEEAFIRVNVNDGIVPLPYCKSGPGKSCPLSQFVEYVQRRRTEVGDFGDVCGLEGDAGHITFLHQD
jgi:acid phosphatase